MMIVTLAVFATLFSACATQEPVTVSPLAACSGAPLMTPELRATIVARHNGIRNRIAMGQAVAGAFTKGCRNMFQLTYDCTLQEKAQQLADTCKTAAADYPVTKGQNVHFVNTAGTAALEPAPAIEAAIAAWEAQAADFKVDVPLTVVAGAPNVVSAVGYFAQIANARTDRVGCGYAKCTATKTVVVCFYQQPRGDDRVVYKGASSNGCTQRDCQAANADATCDITNGLCLAGGALTTPTTPTTTTTTTPDPAFAACNEEPLITSEVRTTILQRHNQIREMIAKGRPVAGTFTKGCRNMFALKYDCSLQARAQKLADTCKAAAADYPLTKGENVHVVAGVDALDTTPAIEAAITAWEGQAADFTINAPLTTAAAGPNVLDDVGYFAQIANAKTTLVGCGYAKCAAQRTVVACVYKAPRADDAVVYKADSAAGCVLKDCQQSNKAATCNATNRLCELP